MAASKKMTNQSLFLARPKNASRDSRERPGPEGGARERNRRERIESLEKSGLALFMSDGVEGVTVDALVRAAKMAKGNFYRYFDDVEALVAHLLAPVAAALAAAFDACEAALAATSSRDELIAAYETLATHLALTVLASPDVVRLYLQESRGAARGARRPIARVAHDVRTRAVRLTEAAHSHGLLRPVPAVVSAHAVVGAVEELVFVGLSGTNLGSPERIAASLVDLVLDGLRVRS